MFSTLSPEDPQIVFGRNHRKTYSTFMAISPCCLKVPQLQYSLGRANKTKQFDLCSSGTVFVCKKKIALSLPVPRKKQNQSLIDTLQLKCSLRVCNKNYIRQIRTSKTHRQSEKVPKVTVSYRQTVSGTEDRKKKAPIIDIDPW